MGRIIMGNVSSFYPDKSFTTMLEGQAVQKPLWIDTSWLLVGHTDETISFVKAANTRGWMLVLNDPAMAKKMLEDASKAGHGAVTIFEGQYWLKNVNKEVSAQTTIDKVLADTEVMSESAKAAVEVASQLAQLKKELGITEAEIIRVPFLHYALDGYSVAYQPGTVNSALIGAGHFAAPDPHGPVIGGVDIFKKQLTQAFAKHKITVHYIENWDLYHRLLGEVHCGSNSLRSPPTSAKWWEAGR
jgi:protein-arginine deiminase